MRLSLRFLVPLLVALAAFAYAAVPFVDGMMQRWFVRDLDERSALIAYTVEEPLRQLLADATPARITAFFNRLTQAKVLAEDMLFATLDPTLRSLKLPDGRPAILSDTVILSWLTARRAGEAEMTQSGFSPSDSLVFGVLVPCAEKLFARRVIRSRPFDSLRSLRAGSDGEGSQAT